MKQCFVFTLFLVSISAAAQEATDALRNFSWEICGSPPSKIDSLIAKFKMHPPEGIGQIDSDRLKALISEYHPATLNAYRSVEVVSNVGKLPSETDVGKEKEWRGVKLQTAKLRKHAFGKHTCMMSVARFNRGPNHLSFIASEHTRKNPSKRNEIFQTISDEFKNSHPKAVVVEGYPEQFPCNEAVRIFLTLADKINSESEYLAKLAIDSGVLVLGGEPDNIGLKSPDNEMFQLLRPMTDIHGVEAAEAYRRVQQQYSFGSQISFFEFTLWYQRINGREFRLENAWEDIAPSFNMKHVRGTNRMSDQVDLKRDAHVVQVIREGLLKRGRVLVVYGADHFPREMPVFESVFGQATTPVAKCINNLSLQQKLVAPNLVRPVKAPVLR